MATRESPCAVWDITIWLTGKDAELPVDAVKRVFQRVSKKWCFQRERGEDSDGKEHYQCRVSLKNKKRFFELKAVLGEEGERWGLFRTSNENKQVDFYACKEETRVAGPWKDNDVYIPRQWRLAEEKYWGFQNEIIESLQEFDQRYINVLYDPKGCGGKSTISHICRLKHGCYMLKKRAKGEEMLMDMQCMLRAKHDTQPNGVFVDLTRCSDQVRLKNLYDALEDIKNGWVTDWRYNFKEWDFDSPVVWVMCNSMPNPKWLSNDRWKFWTIDDEKKLYSYNYKEACEIFVNQDVTKEDEDK